VERKSEAQAFSDGAAAKSSLIHGEKTSKSMVKHLPVSYGTQI